jgi:Kef-type K+ transport system membrane component KefB
MAMVLFASGAAYWLELSPLWVALVMGAVLVNISTHNEQLVAAVRATNSPVRVGLLVLAGALWSAPALVPAVAGTAGLVVLRLVGRLVGSWLAARTMVPLRRDLGRGLIGQGTVALAIALSFRLHYDGPVVDVAYTAVLGAVLVHDVLAPWVLRGLLIDAGEVRGEVSARG